MKTKNHDWLDTENNTPLYSFKVYCPTKLKWLNVFEGGKLLLFKYEPERDAKRREYRRYKSL